MNAQDELIVRVLEVLDTYPENSADRPPTIAFFPPSSNSFFRGNRDGYVKLAIAALRAARGERQKFDKSAPWFTTEDIDWSVGGFEHDDSAHVYLPQKPTRLQSIRQSVIFCLVMIVLFACLIVGWITIWHWLFK